MPGRRSASLAALLLVATGCAAPGVAPSDPTPTPRESLAFTTASPLASPAASPQATPGFAEPIRIPISGQAPDAILLDGETAWVLTAEDGTLAEVDLHARRELRSIDVGFGATHVVRAGPGKAAVGRFDRSGSGTYLAIVDLETGTTEAVATGALGGLAAGEPGTLWALELAGRVLAIDAGARRVIGETAVTIGTNVHTEVQWGAGSAWAGSDGTPVTRIGGTDRSVEATIEVDTGLPFLFTGGRMWGAGPGQLWAIDPEENAVARRIPLPDVTEVLAVDMDGDTAWLAVRHPGAVGAVLELDLASGGVRREWPVGLPAAVRVDAEHVWVASYLTNELLGFDR